MFYVMLITHLAGKISAIMLVPAALQDLNRLACPDRAHSFAAIPQLYLFQRKTGSRKQPPGSVTPFSVKHMQAIRRLIWVQQAVRALNCLACPDRTITAYTG